MRSGQLEGENPLEVALGVTNASFVAQTAEWVPAHLLATLRVAYQHDGFSFVRILQRCPMYTPGIFQRAVQHPELVELLVHDDGVVVPELERTYRNRVMHDPKDLSRARELAMPDERIRLGVFYRDEAKPKYEDTRRVASRNSAERVAELNRELDKYAV